MGAIMWAANPPAMEIDGNGAELLFESGDEYFSVRMPRAAFRRFVETAKLRLDEADRAQHAEIASIHGVCPFAPEDRCMS